MNSPTPIKLLQVFNGGKPCGWLGQAEQGYWFHYSSNSAHQHWVSLLMPPSTNFYQQEDLFPVFAQYLPNTKMDHSPLEYLHDFDGKHLGALSFANPDNPVVKTLLCVPAEDIPNCKLPELKEGEFMLISTQKRRPFADTLIQHSKAWPLVQQLQHIKQKVDPYNRLNGLRWAKETRFSDNLVWHPRPDMDQYKQTMLGFETLNSVLNIQKDQYRDLVRNSTKFRHVMREVIQTYFKNFEMETALLDHLLPMIENGQIEVSLIYQNTKLNNHDSRPALLGMEYLPTFTR